MEIGGLGVPTSEKTEGRNDVVRKVTGIDFIFRDQTITFLRILWFFMIPLSLMPAWLASFTAAYGDTSLANFLTLSSPSVFILVTVLSFVKKIQRHVVFLPIINLMAIVYWFLEL